MSAGCPEGVWGGVLRLSRGCLEGLWGMSGVCLECVWRVSGGCLKGVWGGDWWVSVGSLEGCGRSVGGHG